MHIKTYRNGFTAIFGPTIDAAAAEARTTFGLEDTPRHAFHITLWTREEAQSCSKPAAAVDADRIVQGIQFVGIGGQGSAYWLVVLCPAANRYRLKCGLPPKDFHVTLSATQQDDHRKGLDSLVTALDLQTASSTLLFSLVQHFSIFDDPQGYQASLQLCQTEPQWDKSWLALAHAAQKLHPSISMLAYAHLYSRASDEARQSKIVDAILLCARHAPLGCVLSEIDSKSAWGGLDPSLRRILSCAWPSELRSHVQKTWLAQTNPGTDLLPRHLFSPGPEQPYKGQRFFSWVVPFFLAGSSTPRRAKDVQALEKIGVTHVLTLTKESPLPAAYFAGSNITNTFVPVTNMTGPSMAEIDLMMLLLKQAAESGGTVLVHCGGGKGRAGTVLACYLSAFGQALPSSEWHYPSLSSNKAIALIRNLRPGSIESDAQEEAVRQWVKHATKRGSPWPLLPPEPSDTRLQLDGKFQGADLLVLVGLPGSGKTYFQTRLAARDKSYEAVSGDEDGRSSVLSVVSRKRHSPLIVDRCHCSPASRKEVLQLASVWASHPIAVFFDYEADLCISRASMRTLHPSIRPSAAPNVVKQFVAQLEAPCRAEGFKAVARVTSFEACQELLRLLAPRPTLLKFPRTAHLITQGAETDDDIIASLSAAQAAFERAPSSTCVITEKVDGANMGFSLDDDLNVLVQNRSHYVSRADHAQFAKLDTWVAQHREGLLSVLLRDPSFPERYILYGEWMAACHSVHYTSLPDLFLAFDYYDRLQGTFASRGVLERLLAATDITPTPVLHTGSLPGEAELLQLVNGQSLFATGPREGVYVKVETEDEVQLRGKIVRSGFIAGNEHWSKSRITLNSVAS